jgi:hypothetical protein
MEKDQISDQLLHTEQSFRERISQLEHALSLLKLENSQKDTLLVQLQQEV